MKSRNQWMMVLVAMALATLPACAQESNTDVPKHEINVNFGVAAKYQKSDFFDDYAKGHHLSYDNEVCGLDGDPALSLEYFYHLNKHWAFGGATGFIFNDRDAAYRDDWFHWSEKYENMENMPTPEFLQDYDYYWNRGMAQANIHRNAVYVMPSVKYTYLTRKHFWMYAKASGGLVFSHQRISSANADYPGKTQNKVFLTGQFSPIGMEFGGKHIRGLFEIGGGQQGAIKLGLSYHF